MIVCLLLSCDRKIEKERRTSQKCGYERRPSDGTKISIANACLRKISKRDVQRRQMWREVSIRRSVIQSKEWRDESNVPVRL
jgi:hypothetical protein